MSERLRIAVFVNAFPVTSETFILRQVTGLLDLGHDVHIFANSRGDTSALHDCVSNYQLLTRTTFVDGPPESVVWEMPIRPVGGETWLPGAACPIRNLDRIAAALPVLAHCAQAVPELTRQVLDAREYGYQAKSWSGAYRLSTLLRNAGGFDVLHAHFGPVANSYRFARSLFRAPLLVSFHGYDFTTVPRREGLDVYGKLWQCADRFIANSEYTRERLAALNCPSEKLHVLPVGLDPAAFPFRERALPRDKVVRLLTVARLVEIKGHEFVLRALAALKGLMPTLRYDVVGDGPLRPKLEVLAHDLGLDDIVTFHGACTEAGVSDFLAKAHLFVLTSVNISGDAEGQGLVLQEAQASGLPVIATRHGAFPEGVAPPNNSFIVPERDVDALATAIRDAIQAHAEWPAIARAARAFVEERYNMVALNARLVHLYRAARAQFPS